MTHRAKKRFGQNFLNNDAVIEAILNAINVQPHEQVVEVGPGLGALSQHLLERAGFLSVIELDNDLIPELEYQFGRQSKTGWKIYHQDALEFDLSEIDASRGPIRLVGNLPYNISTPLLFHFMQQQDRIQDMHFMLQKEVVQRICADPDNKSYGRLSIMLQYYCQCEHLFDVAPESFDPPPKVDSAIIRLSPHEQLPHPCLDEKMLSSLVSSAFAQRRKTLRNNLKKLGINAELEAAEIDGGLRAENISLSQYVRLCNILVESRKNITGKSE